MKRDIYQSFVKWKNSNLRKPLLLKGARQVGKTFILREFGESEYPDTAYFNFEEEPLLADLFKESLNPDKIVEKLSIFREKKISPSNTFIIFDEIQEAPRALTALKYFCESKTDYHIAAAGSLLGVSPDSRSPFPVGKVSFLNLFPLSFGEFLDAMGKSKHREYIEKVKSLKAIPEIFHKELISLLKTYFFTGGMPEAVKIYAETSDIEKVREAQKTLLSGYENDFIKHTEEKEAVRIIDMFRSIPVQLARELNRFRYAEINKHARSREYKPAILWLQDSGLVYRSFCIKKPLLPLAAYRDESIFKLFLFDVGLLGAMLNLSPRVLTSGNALFREYNGAFTENYVAQELLASGCQAPLYYWSSNRSAEVDFIIEEDEKIFPLEVKSGNIIQSKSLKVYSEKYKETLLSRATPRNFIKDGNIRNYPLYAIHRFPELSS